MRNVRTGVIYNDTRHGMIADIGHVLITDVVLDNVS